MSSEENNVEKLLQNINKFQVQCFLKENIKKFNEARKNLSGIEPYENFVVLDDDPTMVIHQLVTKKGVEDFLKITPVQKALLIPEIRIFKVNYDKDMKQVSEEEFHFNSFTSPRDIEKMFSSHSERGQDVGIKSFTITSTGKYEADAGSTKSYLTLYFQNVSSLLAQNNKGASFLELILPKKEEKENDILHYQIKVVTGFANPSDPTDTIITKGLRKAIENSKIIHILSMADYDLDFSENGSVEMKIFYNSRIDSMMYRDECDILFLSRSGKEAKSLKEQKNKKALEKSNTNNSLEELKKLTEKVQPSEININTVKEVSKSMSKLINKDDTRSQEEKDRDDQISHLEEVDKQEKYSRLLNNMYESGKIFYTDIDSNLIEGLDKQFMDTIDKLQKDQDRIKNKGQITNEEIKTAAVVKLWNERTTPTKKFDIYRIKDKDIGETSLSKAIDYTNNMNRREGEILSSDKYGNSIKSSKPLSSEERNQKMSGVISKINEKVESIKGKKRINFFFFGDLLDIILNVITKGNSKEILNVKILLGSFFHYDPISFVQGQPKSEIMNLADIPIALDSFITWYLNKVVAPQRPSYKLGNFLKDIIAELLVPAIEDNCYFNVSGIKQGIQVKMHNIIAPENPLMKNGNRITLGDLKKGTQEKQTFKKSNYSNIKDLTNYIYIYSVASPIINAKGDYKSDTKDGLYHLYVGGENGVVKSIKFNKQQQKFVTEARATSDSEEIKRVAGLYTATIRMIGNTFFQLGQMFYIDTSKMSSKLSDPMKEGTLAKTLGIGGYYQIFKVDYEYSNENCETIIEAHRVKEDAGIKVSQKMINDRSLLLSKATNLLRETEVYMSSNPETNKKVVNNTGKINYEVVGF